MDKETKEEFELLSRAVAKGFDEVYEKFDKVDERFDKVDERFDKVDERFDKVEGDLGKLRTDLLDAMDEKAADLKGDLIILMRKEDKKLTNLIDLLQRKMVITQEEAKKILTLEPFPRIAA